MPSSSGLVLAIVAVAAVGFIALWLAISYLVASVSGWKRLRLLYETGPFEGPTFRFAGYVGGSRYRGIALIAGATPAGLYLNVAAPFRVGAGPVFIPWRDVTVSAPSSGRVALVSFAFPKARTTLRAPESVAIRLLERRPGTT